MTRRFAILVMLPLVGAWSAGVARAQAPLALKVGAAKADVTPLTTELPQTYEGIHDRLNARAIVIDNGATSAALITVDTGGLSDDIWKSLTTRIETTLGIPASNVLLTATHTHAAPRVTSKTYEDNIFKAVQLAKQKLQPARIGYGTGVSYLNVNRNIIDPKTHGWWEGANYDGVSDKSVAVVTFSATNGEPIAVYYNYAMHAVITGQLDRVSADVPGAASRYIEESFDDRIVAVWSTGAEGDQNPIYFQQTYDLREIRVKDYAKRGEDISNAMPPGGQGLNKKDPTVIRLMNQQKQMALSMGQLLGEEVMRVMRGIDRTAPTGRIFGAQKTITCPGRQRTDKGRAGVTATYVDGDPVNIRVGLLQLDDIAFGTVNGEAFTTIGLRLKKESPFARTMMVTLTNGRANSGYIPSDAAANYQTFEVLSSRLKPGCAESGIVNGILDLMSESRQAAARVPGAR
jgi:neutral ceramidase